MPSGRTPCLGSLSGLLGMLRAGNIETTTRSATRMSLCGPQGVPRAECQEPPGESADQGCTGARATPQRVPSQLPPASRKTAAPATCGHLCRVDGGQCAALPGSCASSHSSHMQDTSAKFSPEGCLAFQTSHASSGHISSTLCHIPKIRVLSPLSLRLLR